jgi:hypothetical protein
VTYDRVASEMLLCIYSCLYPGRMSQSTRRLMVASDYMTLAPVLPDLRSSICCTLTRISLLGSDYTSWVSLLMRIYSSLIRTLLQRCPIDPVIAKGLHDKFYEKRKSAALDLEKQVITRRIVPPTDCSARPTGWSETVISTTNKPVLIQYSTK